MTCGHRKMNSAKHKICAMLFVYINETFGLCEPKKADKHRQRSKKWLELSWNLFRCEGNIFLEGSRNE